VPLVLSKVPLVRSSGWYIGKLTDNFIATMLLVRLAARLAEDDPGLRKPMLQLLDGWLRHKSGKLDLQAHKLVKNGEFLSPYPLRCSRLTKL
jgi:hypothetical protein